MAKFNIEKITAELSKVENEKIYEVFQEIKAYVQTRLAEAQAFAENQANELQSKIDRL